MGNTINGDGLNFDNHFKSSNNSFTYTIPFGATDSITNDEGRQLNPIKYISLEGGGGKGVVYLGSVYALEHIFTGYNLIQGKIIQKKLSEHNKDIEPTKIPKYENNLFYPIVPAEKRQLIGISGASAGAITSFMLAIGMSSSDIIAEMNKTTQMQFQSTIGNIWNSISTVIKILPKRLLLLGNPKDKSWIQKLFASKEMEVSMFETFLTGPDKSNNGETFFTHKIAEGSSNEYQYQNFLGYKKRIIDILLNNWTKPFAYWLRTILAPVIMYLKINDSNSSVLTRQIISDDKTEGFIYNLLFTRGMFSGLQARKYFASLIKTYLYDRYKDLKNVDGNLIIPKQPIDPEKITFKELFTITGVDLVLTGVNTTRKSSLYFSYKHTPDFPVVDAVQISMNIPLLFKPIWVNYDVDKSNPNKRIKYNGLWVDGGMLNNFPIHAFDKIENEMVDVQGRNISFPLAQEYSDYAEMNADTLGLRLSANLEFHDELEHQFIEKTNGKVKFKNKNIPPKSVPIYDEENLLIFKDYLADLYETLMEPSEEGQIRTNLERNHSLQIDTGNLGLTDFSTPSLDGKRGNKKLGETKVKLIKNAFVNTIAKFGGNRNDAIKYTKTWKPFPTVNADI